MSASKSSLAALTLGAIGVVYGDIGTSPLYAFKEAFTPGHGLTPTPEHVLVTLSALFWAVTAYNITDGTMPETPQLLPSINGFNEVTKNQDGSIDLWFGPEKPGAAPASNWIQTVKDRNFLVALRLYGTGVAFSDQSWKPDDVVKVK